MAPVTLVTAAVVMVASAESATVPEIDAVRFDVLNEPRMAPSVPLPYRPLPPIVKLLASVVAFRRATEPLPLTITLLVPKASLLDPSAAPLTAVRIWPAVTVVVPEYVLFPELYRMLVPDFARLTTPAPSWILPANSPLFD